MPRKSSVVSWSGRPCEQLEAGSTPSGQSAPFDDAGKAVVLDDASGHWESGELAVISTCPLENVSDAPEGVSVCCGTTGCTESGLESVVEHGFAAGLGLDACGTSRNVCLVNGRNHHCFPAVGGTSESALMSSGWLRNTSNTPESSGVSHGTETREPVISSFSAEVTVPSTYPLKNATNTHGSSGELHGTITAAHTVRNASPLLHSLYLLSPLESSWCHGIRTSTKRNGTVRRAGASPKLSKEFYVKRDVNLWHNLKSVMKPQRLY